MRTFDRVEFARRRLIQLVSDASAIPDRQSVVTSLASTCAHVWCFWVHPQPDRPALLISSEWNLSGFVLLGLASSVEWWDTDGERAAILARVASEISPRLCVRHCAAQLLAEHLEQLKEPLGLAALQGTFGPSTRSLGGRGRPTVHHLLALTAEKGQFCVISRNRFALRNRRRQSLASQVQEKLPTPGEIRRVLAQDRAEPPHTIFFHPDHVHPTEILTPPELLPAARRSQVWARVLDRLGIVEKVLGSFACIVPFREESTFLQRMIRGHRAESALQDAVNWRDGIVRDSSMLFLTARFSGNEVLLRVPLSQDAANSLVRADRAYRELLESIPWLRRLIPEAMPLMDVRGWPAHIEQKCQGVTARTLVRDPRQKNILRRRVEEFASALCGSTSRAEIVDDAFMTKHFRSKFSAIRAAAPELARQLSAVEATLVDMTRGRSMPTVRIHGDVNMGNLFFDPRTLKLTGVIDWEASVSDSLPFDFLHYLLSEQQELQKRSWGSLIANEFSSRAFDDDARELLAAHLAALGLGEGLMSSLLVAYWVRGVALRIDRSGGTLAVHWQTQNLVEPLAVIAAALERT